MLLWQSCVILLSVAVLSVTSFQPLMVSSCRNARMSYTFGATVEDSTAEENDVLLTPSQVKLLRKEALKLRARKDLTTFHVPREETMGPFSSATLSKLANDVFRAGGDTTELVDVKGLAIGEKKYARQVAERLAIEVGMEMDADVAMVELKGHTATLFCASDASDRIVLRNSYQPGAWKKRVKAPRDHRGQIVKD